MLNITYKPIIWPRAGTGYSYVDDDSAYTTNEKQIASDLLALLSGFYKKYPVFQSTPFYIFSESYGKNSNLFQIRIF